MRTYIFLILALVIACGSSEESLNEVTTTTVQNTNTTLTPTTTSAPTTTTTTVLDISDISGDKVYDIDLDPLFFEDYYAVKWNQETDNLEFC